MGVLDVINRANKREELLNDIVKDFSCSWVGTINDLKKAIKSYEKVYSNRKTLKVSVDEYIKDIITKKSIKFSMDIYKLNYIKVDFDIIELKSKKYESVIKVTNVCRVDGERVTRKQDSTVTY